MRKLALAGAASLIIVLSLVMANVESKNSFSTKLEGESYTLTLNSSNCDFIPVSRSPSGQSDNSNSPVTSNGNPITFAYTYAKKENGCAMNISMSTGSIANVTPITGIYSIAVNYLYGECKLSYGNSYGNYTESLIIESGISYSINYASYFKITENGVHNTPITDITIKYSCSASEQLEPVMAHTHHGFHYLAKEATVDKPGNREFYACEECQYVSLVKEDEGNYVDAVLTYDLSSDHIAYLPSLNNSKYLRNPPQFPYPIAINMEIPNANYNFDNTGTSDCSITIQQAIDNLALAGGGTIYIPTGKYRLDNHLTIKNRVTLVGDFYGPNADDYGTVFLCNKTHDGSSTFYEDSQIHLNSNTGINGITFYYPNQSINNVTEYGYTISVRSNAAANMANLFFINSYNGITINNATSGGGELANIENVYGTFLKNGIVGYAQTDVGYWSNINISPSYYANAIAQYRCNNSASLYRYTKDNLTAITLGDLDDFGLHHVNIDNAETGIYFPKECVRQTQAFWGFLNDINLTSCATGILCRGIYQAGAALFTHSSLGVIVNTSKFGMIKLAKSSYDLILGDGKTLIEKGSESYEASPAIDDTNTYDIPNYLYYIDGLDKTGNTDISSALQTEINKIHTGGLIVLPNGTYRLDNPITIPSHTMLTSFATSFSRSAGIEGSNELVKFVSYSDDACVKLNSYAGINGIRIYNANKDPDTAYNKLTNSQSDSFVSVKGIGNHSFALNTEVSYTFTGFDFSNVSNHYVKYCYGASYQTFIKAGVNGKVVASLSNLSFLVRTYLSSFAVSNNTALDKYSYAELTSNNDKYEFVKNILRDYTTMILINSSSDELLLNCFAYGYKCLVNTTSSTVLAINTSIDYLKDANYAYVINGGDVTIVNAFRVYGKSFNRISGHLTMYGRYDFTMKKESYYDSDVEASDPYEVMPSSGLTTQNLSTCESNTGLSGATRNSTKKHSGTYSWRASNQTNPSIQYTFNAIDISSFYNKGYLRFYLYCANINSKGNTGTVELTSSGECDNEEMSYDIDSQIKVTGWNEIIIELSSGSKGSANDFDRTKCNYFRFYALSASCYYYVDDIDFLYETNVSSSILLNECETTDNLTGASLSNFSMFREHSWTNDDHTNAVFSLTFNSVDISSYMSNGYLVFYFYCPDVSKLGTRVNVELTSSGTYDLYEIYLNVTSQVTRDGWNEIVIPLNSMKSGSPGTVFDPTACNFFRVYTLNSNCYFNIDHIMFINY